MEQRYQKLITNILIKELIVKFKLPKKICANCICVLHVCHHGIYNVCSDCCTNRFQFCL